MRFVLRWLFWGALIFIPAPVLLAQQPPSSKIPVNTLFREQFYLPSAQKASYKASPAGGFLLLEKSSPDWDSDVAVISDFANQALRTRTLKGIHSVDEAKKWIEEHQKTFSFEGVPIVELSLPPQRGESEPRYWVGNKSFDSLDKAQAAIALTKSIVETQGGNFDQALALTEELRETQPPSPEEVAKVQAQFQREEGIALRWIDQLDIGEKLYGPFQGTPAGEPLLWQSFGESTWRSTNLGRNRFNSIVGFWTQRIVFKGIRFPLSTIDPYVEVTVAPEATGIDGGNQLDTVLGAEWRPLQRVAFFENFRPWGIPLLEFVRNYRFYVQYMERRNLKDEILNIRHLDARFGFNIFYEWGIDLPPADQKPQTGFVGLLTHYVWGEYFGDYAWRHSNFTGENKFDSWILDTSLILGIKTPGVRLPPNPINDQLVLMPYFRLGLIADTELSNSSDNRYFVAVGVRWMPFRDYRFVNNEWLFKTKFFAEYLAVGKVQNFKQDDSASTPDEDWRIGLSFSIRRF